MLQVEKPFTLPKYILSIPLWCYLLQCLLGTLVLRVIFFMFRAWAVQRGDFPDSENTETTKPQPGLGWKYWEAFRVCFYGFGQSKAHADLWLNAIIGFVELAVYPVLMKLGYMTTIAGWLAVKTAGSWGGWKVSRTSFNRFLLNNILELAIAYLWLTPYVQQG